MPTRIKDVDGARSFTIDASARPESVFFLGKGGMVVEFDRSIFLRAIRQELGAELGFPTADQLISRFAQEGLSMQGEHDTVGA